MTVKHIQCPEDFMTEIVQSLVVGIGFIIIMAITITAHIKFNKINTENKKKLTYDEAQHESMPFIFKYIFHSCMIMAILESLLFVINSIICYISSISLTFSYITFLLSLIIYLIINSHIFILWLSRLYYAFKGSTFAKSNKYFIFIAICCIMLLLLGLCGFISLILSYPLIALSSLIICLCGYIFVSMWLLRVFLRQLLQLITSRVVTMRFDGPFISKTSLQNRTSTIDETVLDSSLIHCVAKYFILGTASFTTTLLVLIFGLFSFIQSFFNENSDNISYITLQCLKSLVMIDVVTNTLCIYLQFKFGDKAYFAICGWIDKKINERYEQIALKKIRQRTFSFYSEKFSGSQHEDRNKAICELELEINSSPTLPNTQRITTATPSITAVTSNEQIFKQIKPTEDVTIDLDKLLISTPIILNKINEGKKYVSDKDPEISPIDQFDDQYINDLMSNAEWVMDKNETEIVYNEMNTNESNPNASKT